MFLLCAFKRLSLALGYGKAHGRHDGATGRPLTLTTAQHQQLDTVLAANWAA
ncbi:MAG: hypothetical protein PSX71_13105 [bacterium]|nr:hypothetical protein [bacterium]